MGRDSKKDAPSSGKDKGKGKGRERAATYDAASSSNDKGKRKGKERVDTYDVATSNRGSNKDKGKGKERADTYYQHDSRRGEGDGVIVASSINPIRSNAITYSNSSQGQYASSAPNDLTLSYSGGQFSDQTPYTATAVEQGNDFNLETPWPSGDSSSAPVPAEQDGNYASNDYAKQPGRYEYATMSSTDFNATPDMQTVTTNFGRLQMSSSARPVISYSSTPSTAPIPIPTTYDAGQDSETGTASNQWDSNLQTPRQSGFFAAGGGAGGGGGGGGKKVGPTEFQRRANEEYKDPLDYKDYKVHHSREFVPGRCLKVFWFEPPGAGSKDDDTTTDGGGTFQGSRMPGKVRRFIIIETRKGHSTCIPISTYGGRATLKPGCHPEDHSMIYTNNEKQYLVGEYISNPKVEMLPVPAEFLKSESRINYSKKYTIEHNFRVKFIGEIAGDDFWYTVKKINTWYSPVSQPSRGSRGNQSSQVSRNSQAQASSSKNHKRR